MDAADLNIPRLVNAWLAKRLPRALERIGEETTADIKTRLGLPCPAFNGVPAGKHSPPGHEPYMETGALQAGIGYHANESTTSPAVTIFSTRSMGGESPNVPFWLEFGTSKMAARPFMRPAKNRGMRTVPFILKQELGG